ESELPKTLETLYWMTQFGRMNSLNTLVREMHLLQSPKTPLLLDHLPGSISSMFHYLREKGNFAYIEENGLDNMMYIASKPDMLNYYLNNHNGRFSFLQEDSSNSKNQGPQALGSLLLDEPLILELASNPELRRFVKKNHIHLFVPEGWMEGVNPFTQSSLEDMAGRLSVIYRRAKAIEERYQKMSELDPAILPLSWREAVSAALRAPFQQWIGNLDPELQNNLKFLKNTALPSPVVSQFTQTPAITYQSGDVALEMSLDDAICDNLKPQLILPQAIEDALHEVSRDPLVQQAALEVLSQAGEIYSPRRTALALKAMHQKILAFAKDKNISEDKIYYVLPRNRGSFCVVNQMYRMINGIPSERFLVCPDLQSEDRTDVEHHEEKWIQFCEMLSDSSHQYRESEGSVGRWLLAHAKKGILDAFKLTHHKDDSKVHFSKKNMVVVLDDLAGSGHTLGNVFWYQLSRTVSENAWIYLAPIVSTRTALDTGHIKKYQASYPGLVYEPHHWIDTFPSTAFYKALTPAEKTLFEAIFQDKGYAGVNTNIVFPWMGTDTNNRFWGRFFVSPHTLNGFGNKHVGKAWKEIQQLKNFSEDSTVTDTPPKAC
ncbi:MAG: hypothetical protein K2X66_13040, partial [Cyanobacteria bacterium]|nr:hypothetical protein [Cyanobacteriota bacterium]